MYNEYKTAFNKGVLSAVMPGGERRAFRCSELLSLAKRAWWRRLRLAYCEDRMLDPESAALTLLDLLTFTLDDEQRTLDALHLGYPGDHADIDWYNAADPGAVEEALAHFFLACFAQPNAKTGASPASSLRSDGGSQEEKAIPATDISSSNAPRISPPPPGTTTI